LREPPEPSSAHVELADPSGWAADLHIFVPPNEAAFAQILTPGAVPVNVGLAGTGVTPEVILSQTETWGSPTAQALPAGEHGRLALEFLVAGQARSGAEVIGADTARGMLEGKVADPIGAALGGYLLLRLGELEPLSDWVENLANWFPWLADGAVIAGELAAQVGETTAALARFLEIEERGLPLLTEGFSLTLHRLRRLSQRKGPPANDGARARRLLETLRGWTPFLDLSSPTLTFRGASLNDPAGSQDEAPEEPSHDDWIFDLTANGVLEIRPSARGGH
jgi:hypothetical protein